MAGGGPSKRGRGPYRGEDRRAPSGVQDGSLGPFIGVGVGLLAAMGLFTLGPVLGSWTSVVVDASRLEGQLDAAAVTMAAIAGALSLIRWRMVGEAASLWVGAALLALAVAIGIGTVVPDSGTPELLVWMQPASRVAVLWLLFRALRAPEVDATLRLWRTALAAAGVAAAVALAFRLVPGLEILFASAGDALATGAADAPFGLVLMLAWVGFGVGFGFRGVRTRRWLYAWFGLAFFGLAFAEVLRLVEQPADSLWATGPNALLVLGLLCAVVGATRELMRAFQQQQARLLATMRSERSKDARLEAERQALEERAHEARNALLAIEGATHTLTRYRAHLDDTSGAGLAEAIEREIGRLQQLVSADRVLSTKGEFRLADAVAAIAAAARSRGTTVHVDVPDHLMAYGRPAETGQVVQNLLENARRYAPGSPVHVRAEAAPGGVLLRVDDEGPGIPVEERAAIFQRGHRGSTAAGEAGTGLGLYVSGKLMREQDGDLWVEDRPGGGASFVLWLPVDPAAFAVGGEDLVDVSDEALQPATVTPLFGLRRSRAAKHAVARHRRASDHDVGEQVGR